LAKTAKIQIFIHAFNQLIRIFNQPTYKLIILASQPTNQLGIQHTNIITNYNRLAQSTNVLKFSIN